MGQGVGGAVSGYTKSDQNCTVNSPVAAVMCADPDQEMERYCEDIQSCMKKAGEKTIPRCEPPGTRPAGRGGEVCP